MKKKLMLLILCLTGALTFLIAEDEGEPITLPPENKVTTGKAENIPIPPGYEPSPECRLYTVTLPYMGGAVHPGHENDKHINFFKETLGQLNAMTSVAAFLDKKSKFDTKQTAPEGVVYNMVAWTGAFLVKKAGTYTFLSTFGRKPGDYTTSHGIAVFVNGKGKLAAGPGTKNIQSTLDVDLKPGMANLMVVIYANNQSILTTASPLIRYKLQNAVKDYREITPANLYHKEEEEDW